MAILLKGIEIENFKSYTERQTILFLIYQYYLVLIAVEKVLHYRHS